MKKGLFYSLFIIISSSIFAIPPHPCDPEYDDDCCEEPLPGPFAFAYPFDRELSCPQDFYVYGSFLFMQAKEDGLEYAISNNNAAAVGSFPVTGGNVQDFSNNGHDWDFNPGFRAGFGFYIDHDLWSLGADLTYIHVTDTISSSVHGGTTLIPLWLPPDTVLSNENVTASASWKVKYITGDFNIGKAFHVSRFLAVNPFFGIRGAWIQQYYIARYGGHFGTGLLIDGTVMDGENKFWGFGPRAGIINEWMIKGGWNFFGKLALAMLYGKFDVEQEVVDAGEDEDGFDAFYDIRDEFYMNVPNFEIAIGVNWGTRFSNQRYYVSLQAAWEFHYWWDQNFMRKFFDSSSIISTDTVSRGDLSFNGFSFRLNFDI